ncbi:MAG: DUF262 domain-containing protein [Methylocella sp.]
MSAKGLGITAHDVGIGATINQNLLMVPPNQRSYAWEDSHVATLFEDLSGAIRVGDQPYFLGTLVLTQGIGERLEVADGQQRLATTSILIAAIRDFLESIGDKRASEKYTSDYLLIYDEIASENTPKLQLNYEDNDYFLNQILITASEGTRKAIEPTISSHKRLYLAAGIARQHVIDVTSQSGKADKAKELYKWVKFLKESAMVIAIKVPDHINAYTMFETLNDRGLRASQTDILKNFLFGKAQDRLTEVQMKWSSMTSTIETVGDENLLLTYLRHHWTLTNGYTAERELASLVKEKVTGRQQAVNEVIGLDELSSDYAGLFNPVEYSGWKCVDKQTRSYIFIITTILAIEQILPLLLAILNRFDPPQIKASAKMLLFWSVRFLIAGSGGGGPLDRAYGQLAKEVMEGTVKTAAQIREKVRAGILRTDAEFVQAFSKGRITKTNLARYYLRSLELYKQDDRMPELGGVIDDSYTLNVEHVMPPRESPDWKIPEQTAQQFRNRLGNMVLLSPAENVKLGTRPFKEKRMVYAQSPLLLTQAVSSYRDWGPTQIDEWQEHLAELAVKIWPA